MEEAFAVRSSEVEFTYLFSGSGKFTSTMYCSS